MTDEELDRMLDEAEPWWPLKWRDVTGLRIAEVRCHPWVAEVRMTDNTTLLGREPPSRFTRQRMDVKGLDELDLRCLLLDLAFKPAPPLLTFDETLDVLLDALD
jgi:hypothetical protein